MLIQPIQFGDAGQVATAELLARFRRDLASDPRLAPLEAPFQVLSSLDRQYGGTAPLELEETGELVGALLTELARFDADPELVLGVAVWALRHDVALLAVEPVANALAHRSNQAGSPAELSAVVGLMDGVVRNVSPRLSPDLERSNPERAWRVLHLNFAITAIRTEDGPLMDLAFDALETALPDERAGFYAEALALALAPGIAPVVRERIEARHLKWTARS